MRHGLLCGLALPILMAAAPVHAQPAPRPAPPSAQPAPDPAYEAALRAFDALPENDRRAIQDALMWTGDYNAVVGVNFGKRAYDGIRAYQKRRNSAQTGILSDADWSALIADGKRARDSVRFATLDDPRTGVRLGVPMRVTERSVASPKANPVGTTAYQTGDGAVRLDTIAAPLATLSLEQAFTNETATKPGRKVTYKFQRPEFFVVSGEDAGRAFYTRAAKNATEMRGFTFSYPAARKADFDRVMLAVANSFDPFPTTPAATAATSTQPRPPTAPQPPRQAFVATGIVIAPGKVLTSAALTQACANPTVNGAPARADAGGASSGAIILSIQGGRAAQVAVGSAPADNESVVALSAVAGQPAQLASGALRMGGASPLLVAGVNGGAMGAPVFDRRGQLIGVVAENPKPVAVASLGAAPAINHKVVPASAFASLLPASPAAAGDNLSAGAIAQRIAGSIVAIGCGS